MCTATGTLARRAASSIAGAIHSKGAMGKSDSAVPMMMGESSSSAAATQAWIISMLMVLKKPTP